MEWMDSLREAIKYMETHLLEEMDVCDVANAVHISPFYFQKAFSLMTGCAVGEYIRQRRLYLAALDLVSGSQKVIDVALKYGYQTPESFAKAFARFHGCTPQQVKGHSEKIRVFLPMKITISIQGGSDMDYSIEKMDSFQLIGFEKKVAFDNSYEVIPKFWSEFCTKCQAGGFDAATSAAVEGCKIGEFGLCVTGKPEDKTFSYIIAGRYDGREVPQGMRVIDLPAMTWAKFQCVGPLPGALQAVNTQLFKDWLPNNNQYQMASSYNIEWYAMGDPTAADYESAIWVPVENK